MAKPTPTPTPFLQRFRKQCRDSTEQVRALYTATRHLQHPLRYATARRVARRQRPSAAVAIDPAAGFRLFPSGTFAEADELAAEAQRLLAALDGDPVSHRQGRGRKRFLINLLDRTTLTAAHPAVRLALRPDLLQAVVSYIGSVPVLRSVQIFYSGTLEKEPESSQLYHCDGDDTRQIKIFVLCSDVSSANGPLTILDAARSSRVRRATGYRFHARLSDAQVDAVVGGPAKPVEVVGPPGTLCLVDTSRCFHYGSRVEPGAAPRLVTMIQYLSPSSFMLPGDYRSGAAVQAPTPLDGDRGLTPLQRAVLTGNHDVLAGRG
jgi:hypothetical protein